MVAAVASHGAEAAAAGLRAAGRLSVQVHGMFGCTMNEQVKTGNAEWQ